MLKLDGSTLRKERTYHPLTEIHKGSKIAKNWYPIKTKQNEPRVVSSSELYQLLSIN